MHTSERAVTELIAAAAVQKRVAEMGAQIGSDYAESTDLLLIGVLKGCFVFLADLCRSIQRPVMIDFLGLASYGDETRTSGVVQITADLTRPIEGKDVVVVEDIIDTGLTLSYLLTTLQARDPASIEVVTLLDKSVRRIAPLDLKFVGFDCPDRFVVGYGLDVGERYRNLPFILEVADQSLVTDHPEVLEAFLGATPDEPD